MTNDLLMKRILFNIRIMNNPCQSFAPLFSCTFPHDSTCSDTLVMLNFGRLLFGTTFIPPRNQNRQRNQILFNNSHYIRSLHTKKNKLYFEWLKLFFVSLKGIKFYSNLKSSSHGVNFQIVQAKLVLFFFFWISPTAKWNLITLSIGNFDTIYNIFDGYPCEQITIFP